MNVGRLALDSLQKFGEYPALQFEGRAISNLEQDFYARALGSILRDRNVEPGDRVLVMMPNTPEILAAFQACWKVGAVIVPVTPMLNAREVGYILQHSDAKVAITSPILASRIRDAAKGAPEFQDLLVAGASPVEGAINIEPLIRSVTAVSTLADRSDDDLALLLYTSGTTGAPKGVMLTHENMLSNAHATAALSKESGYREMTMHVLPLSHAFGVMMMNVGYVFGVSSVLHTHFDATKALQSIQDHKVRRFSAVPTMLTYLINHPEREKYDTSSLEMVMSGGAALPNEVRLNFEKLYNCKVREGYGLSETAPTSAGYAEGEDYRVGSVGRSIPGVKVCIMDFNNKILGPGQTGEICIQGPNIMKGYWKNEEATRDAIVDGWFHSGDVGYIDEDGYVYLTDRKKDLIIKGGENISPREIEEAIYEHPAVAECAVVSVPDPTFGENIWAVVVPRTGMTPTEDEIKEHVAKYVTKFKVPARVQFSAYLPKNPVGKILKKDIRSQVADKLKKEAAPAAG